MRAFVGGALDWERHDRGCLQEFDREAVKADEGVLAQSDNKFLVSHAHDNPLFAERRGFPAESQVGYRRRNRPAGFHKMQ